jgi:hypothetical protein
MSPLLICFEESMAALDNGSSSQTSLYNQPPWQDFKPHLPGALSQFTLGRWQVLFQTGITTKNLLKICKK